MSLICAFDLITINDKMMCLVRNCFKYLLQMFDLHSFFLYLNNLGCKNISFLRRGYEQKKFKKTTLEYLKAFSSKCLNNTSL